MTNPINNRRQELLEQLEDALIGLELVEMQEKELEELESSSMTAEETERMKAFFAATEERALKLIEDQYRTPPKAPELDGRAHLRRFVVAAAAVVLLTFAGLLSAVATVPPVRAKVLELIIGLDNGRSILGAKERADTAIKVPAGWAGDYFPSYIPEEFNFSNLSESRVSVTYHATDGKYLFFSESEESDVRGFNTEGMLTWRAVLNSEDEAVICARDGKAYVFWAHNDKYLSIIFDGTPDIAMKIAESVRTVTQK